MTSWDGPCRIPETQLRELLVDDWSGRLFGVLETDGRFYIHTQFFNPSKAHFKHYKEILASLENMLRERGLTRYFTMAEDVKGFRFNKLMGFHTIYEVWNDQYEVMVKEL